MGLVLSIVLREESAPDASTALPVAEHLEHPEWRANRPPHPADIDPVLVELQEDPVPAETVVDGQAVYEDEPDFIAVRAGE